jgi:UDP-N-acetylmuramate dehydrogenase
MQTNDVILGAELRLTNATQAIVEENCKRYAEKRAWLPKGKSMGCVFKNPQGAVAGKLIESAGLKGLRIGGAVISKTHANFIINDNGAKSSDICALIQIIKNAVFAQYKIRLEEEIRYLD